MKNFLALTILFSLLGGLFFINLNLAKAGVAGAELDQAYEQTLGSGWTVIGNWGDRIQTFRPSKNRIVSVDVYLIDRQDGSTITLQVIKEDTGAVVGTESHQLSGPADDTWETFSFTPPHL